MSISDTLKINSICREVILFVILVPAIPPNTPPTKMNGSIVILMPAKLVETPIKMSEEDCEKNIINIELKAAGFAFIENSNINIAIFSGPPPIPKNAEIIPSTKPIIIITNLFWILRDLNLCLYLINKNIVKINTDKIPDCMAETKLVLLIKNIK